MTPSTTIIEFDAMLCPAIRTSALFIVENELDEFARATKKRGNGGTPEDDWTDMRDAWRVARDRVLVRIALVDRLDAIDRDDEPILRAALSSSESDVFVSAIIDASNQVYNEIGSEVEEASGGGDADRVLALGRQLASLQGLLKRVQSEAAR